MTEEPEEIKKNKKNTATMYFLLGNIIKHREINPTMNHYTQSSDKEPITFIEKRRVPPGLNEV